MEIAIVSAFLFIAAVIVGGPAPEAEAKVKPGPTIIRQVSHSENPIRLYGCRSGLVVEERGLETVLVEDSDGPIRCGDLPGKAVAAPIIEPEMGPEEATCPSFLRDEDGACTKEL